MCSVFPYKLCKRPKLNILLRTLLLGETSTKLISGGVVCEVYLGIVQRQLILRTLEHTLTAREQQKSLVIIGIISTGGTAADKNEHKPFLNQAQHSVGLVACEPLGESERS